MKLMFFCCLLSPIIFSCSSTKNKVLETPVVTDEVNDSRVQYPQAEVGPFQKNSDPFKLDSVQIVGNYMDLFVTYSGGCQRHEFRLIGSEISNESLPASRNLQLLHKANGDQCKSLIREKIRFSISSLAQHYNPGNEIMLKFDKQHPELLYRYE